MGLNHHSFEELLLSASKNGFHGIEVPKGAFENINAAKNAAKRMNDMGMQFGLIMAPCDMYKVDDATFNNALKTFGKWAKLARIAGCARAYNHIWPGNNEREYNENFDWHINRLTAIYNVLSNEGLQYGIEFMGPRTVREKFRFEFIHSLMGVLSLINEIDNNIGFVFDTFHWYCSGSNTDDLYFAARNTTRIINIHLADPNPRYTREDQIDDHRSLPKVEGIIDAASILHLFSQNGYDGPVIIEPMKPVTDRYSTMDLDKAVQDAANCLHNIFEAAGIKTNKFSC
jgi:sugar phosphate isomerase/epimerase